VEALLGYVGHVYVHASCRWECRLHSRVECIVAVRDLQDGFWIGWLDLLTP
jgi:hypothetical protein